LTALSLKEDGKDITSEVLCQEAGVKEAVIIAKEEGVLCGVNYIEKIVQLVDPDVLVDPFLEEGDPLKDRMMIVGIEAEVTTLLRIERVLLNFLCRLSGIASLTKEFVDAVEGTGAVILDTRKTVPGWRFLDKYAVTVGGGINHRMGLEDVALIKDTHVDVVGSVSQAITDFREQEESIPLIVEVRDLVEFHEALEHAKLLNRIILDNFNTDMLAEAVDIASGRILLEASGGINLENAREIAETGVHFLSIGALTHSVPGFDFSFKIS